MTLGDARRDAGGRVTAVARAGSALLGEVQRIVAEAQVLSEYGAGDPFRAWDVIAACRSAQAGL